MSRDTKKNVPAVRFAGFEGVWKESLLGQLGTFTKGAPLSKADISNEGTPFILYGELYTTYSEVINAVVRKTRRKVNNEQLSRVGDVILPTSGETSEEIATASCLMLPGVILAGDLIIYRNSLVDGRLISYIIRNVISSQIACIAQGKSVVHVRIGELKKIAIRYPNPIEQKKIALIFCNLDKLIELRQKKLERLILLKKQLLNKLFPRQGQKVPDIRFAGFEGEWRNRMIKCLAQFRRGLTYKPSDVVPRGVRVLRSSNIEHGSICYRDDDVFVRADAVNIDNVKKGDILVTAANGSSHLVGKHAVITGSDLAVHGGFMLLLSAKEPYFFNANMSSPRFRNLLNICIAGGNGAIGNLKTNELAEMAIYVPQEREQTRIGQFFQTLDKLIELLQKELEKQRTLKQTLLREMFV